MMLHKIDLLEGESERIAKDMGSVATVTFFEGELSKVQADIKARIAKILEANPWLGGTLKSTKTGVDLVYDDSVKVEDIVHFDPEGLHLHSGLSYSEITIRANPYIVKTPRFTLNKADRVTSFVFVRASAEEFVMILSISHSAVDGHSYYHILNMLSEEAEIVALNVKRKHEVSPMMIDAVGRDVYKYMTGAAHIFNILYGMLTKRAKIFSYYVDPEKIDAIKKAHCDREVCDYISTNDILTSRYASFMDVRLCSMAINFRGKLADLNENDAGNYESIVVYDKEVYREPSGIRKSLMSGKVFRGLKKKLPSFFEAATCDMGLITNWAPFSKEIKLRGAKEKLHLPLTTAKGKIPYDVAIIFRAKENKTAVIYYSSKYSKEDFLAANLPVSEEVFA